MRRFKLNLGREDDTENNEIQDDVNPEPTPPEGDVGDDGNEGSANVETRIRERQEARRKSREKTDGERTNLEDTSNVDAAIAAAAAKVNPSPDTVEDAAEKRRYAELVNNENADQSTDDASTGEDTSEPLMSEEESSERTAEAEAEVASDEESNPTDVEETDTTSTDEETAEITEEVEDSTAAVDNAADGVSAVEAFLDIAQDSLLGNGISPLAASIGTSMVNTLAKKAYVKPMSALGVSQEAFSENRRYATENMLKNAGDVVVRVYRRIIKWFQDCWTWLTKFFKSFRQGADKTMDDLKALEKHWNGIKNQFRGRNEVINLAVTSDLSHTVTSTNYKAADAVLATAITLESIFKDLNAASGNSLAKWAQHVRGNATNSFSFAALPTFMPRCMQSNRFSSGQWDVFNSPELVGNRMLSARIPTRYRTATLTKDMMANVDMELAHLNYTEIQQLTIVRDSSSVDKLFGACYKIQESVKSAKVALKRQELDMESLNRTIEHLGKEIEDFNITDIEKAERRLALSNLSMQIMLSQKLFNTPVMKLATYALKVQRSTMILTKKVINHKDSVM